MTRPTDSEHEVGQGPIRPGASGPGGPGSDPSWEHASAGRRTRPPDRSRSTRWRAVAVVGLAVALAAAGLALTRGPAGPDGAPVPGREDAAPTEVSAGQCLASLPGEAGTDLDVVPCDEQHLGEVVGVTELPDDTGPAGWPGDGAVRAASSAACADAFTDWVGVEPTRSELGLLALPPSEAAWRAGADRSAVCIAEGPGLVGSVRGTAR